MQPRWVRCIGSGSAVPVFPEGVTWLALWKAQGGDVDLGTAHIVAESAQVGYAPARLKGPESEPSLAAGLHWSLQPERTPQCSRALLQWHRLTLRCPCRHSDQPAGRQ
jgi:hypothetical protein